MSFTKDMKYRREIDGLRALAVVPVIFFHAGFEMFSGGFVGVDIFFVISGYLITTIIISELELGNFSIINFYERRTRRILPSLFFVISVCIPFAWFWLLPSEIKDFARSIAAVSIFASNFLFWRESGYFDADSDLRPLLHTWSLAVEEQYYIIFPVFLLIFWKLGKRSILILLAIIFVASLALAQWASFAKPTAAFFLLPTRAWELLIGAFAAFYFSYSNRMEFNRAISEVGGWAGVVLIFYSIFSYDKNTPFPGIYALVPTVGAVFVILFATQKNTVGIFLGNKLFVGIGLVSYSAYLWHQPIFAFARHRNVNEPSIYFFTFLIVCIFLLAYFNWRCIESPFRNKYLFGRRHLFILSISASVFLFSFGVSFGYNFINNNILIDSSEKIRLGEKSWKDCLNSGGNPRNDFIEKPCIYNSPVGEGETLLLIGDSHAQVLQFDISSNLRVPGKVVLYAGGSCPPFFLKLNSDCARFHKNSADYAIGNLNVKTVVLSARWSTYIRNADFDTSSGFRIKSKNPFGRSEEDMASAQAEIRHVIDYWLSKKVNLIFVLDYPTNGKNINFIYEKSKKFGINFDGPSSNVGLRDYYNWISPLVSVLKDYRDNKKFIVVDSYSVICEALQSCLLVTDHGPLLGDDNHASQLGRELLGRYISNIVNNMGSTLGYLQKPVMQP